MRKMLIALSLIGLVGSVHAEDVNKNASDSYSVFAGINSNTTAQTDKGTGYTLRADYTKYINENVFVQPQVQYFDSKNEYKDKHIVGYLNAGYTFKLDNNITISPKAGVGIRHSTSVDSSDNGMAYNVGVDVGFAKNWTVGLQYNRFQGKESNKYVEFTSLTVGYKF